MSSSSVSVARLKARLSEYLRRVKAGDDVIVTERGVPVARLSPLPPGAAQDDRLAELAGQGLVRLPRTALDVDAFLARPRPLDVEGRSLELVLEERAEGW